MLKITNMTPEEKICTKCNISKPLDNFSKEKKHKDGLSYYCRDCRKEYRLKNYEKIKKQNNEYNQINIEKRREWKRNYFKLNKNEINEWRKKYRIDVSLKNPLFVLKTSTVDSIRHAIKNKGYLKKSKTIKILGCSFEFFKSYIESRWSLPDNLDANGNIWMNWSNYGNPKDGIVELNKTWDLDHITPMASADTEDDVIRLNHYINFQPLCSYINRFVKKDSISF
jgi:hypothetical protein